MPTYNVTNPDGSKLSFKSNKPLDAASIQEVIDAHASRIPRAPEPAGTGQLADSTFDVATLGIRNLINPTEGEKNASADYKNVLSGVPFHGAAEAFKEGQKSGNEVLGHNVAGDMAGGALGFLNSLGTAFAPVSKGAAYIPRVVQAGSESFNEEDKNAHDTLMGNRDVLPGVKPSMEGSIPELMLSDILTQIRKDPANAGLIIAGLKEQIGGLVAPKAANLDIPVNPKQPTPPKIADIQAAAEAAPETAKTASNAEQPQIPVAPQEPRVQTIVDDLNAKIQVSKDLQARHAAGEAVDPGEMLQARREVIEANRDFLEATGGDTAQYDNALSQIDEQIASQAGSQTATAPAATATAAPVASTAPQNQTAAAPQASRIASPGSVPPVIQGIPNQAQPAQGSGVVNRILGAVPRAAERFAINAEDARLQQERLSQMPAEHRLAIENGVPEHVVSQISEATPQEALIFKRMMDAAERFVRNRRLEPHANIVGEESVKRIEDAKKLQKTIGKEQGALTKALPKKVAIDASEAALRRMNEAPGGEGIVLDEEGNLDFSQSTLLLDEAAQKSVQRLFSSLEGKSPHQLDLIRKAINEELGVKSSGGKTITSTEESLHEAIRTGAADVIEQMSPEYKVLNDKYREITTTLKEMDKHFRKIDRDATDLMNTKAAMILRRLTSNAGSGAEIEGLFQDLEHQLGGSGVTYGTNLKNLQEFSNALNEIFPLTIQKNALAGQVNMGIPKSLVNVAERVGSKAIGKTQATKAKFFKDLVNQAAERAEGRNNNIRQVAP